LALLVEFPHRTHRLLVMNTALAVGASPGPGFDAWKAFMRTRPDVDVAVLMKRGTPQLTDDEAAAYGAPFPDQHYKAGVRRFPELVMVSPEMDGAELSRKAAHWLTNEWRGQSFMAVGMQDPVLGPAVMANLRTQIRGCPPPLEIADGGHFVQEWGEQIAEAAVKAFV
jgi:haloalkane dehalogenase